MRRITVFEYDKLTIGDRIGDVLISERDIDILTRFHECNGEYFELTRRGVRFKEYVGVLQLGDLTIEILPKVDRTLSRGRPGDLLPWREIFTRMLARAGILPEDVGSRAQVLLREGSFFDLYVALFLREVRGIQREGFVKRYLPVEGEIQALKGRLLFEKQIAQEARGKVGFHARYERYDRNHLVNQIFLAALTVLSRSDFSPIHRGEIYEALEAMSDVAARRIEESDFRRITLDRKTARYDLALSLARPIILSLMPDLRGGADNLVALLFDMNEIWEKFILAEIRRAASSQEISVRAQVKATFWEKRHVRADIVLTTGGAVYVLDTKWKALEKPNPSIPDLHQMFTYNNLFKSRRSLLVYPDVWGHSGRAGDYDHVQVLDQKEVTHECAIDFVRPWKQDGDRVVLNKDIGRCLLDRALNGFKA